MEGKPQLNLQANTEEKSTGVKNAAKKDSHATLAWALADTEGDPNVEKAIEQLLHDFKETK